MHSIGAGHLALETSSRNHGDLLELTGRGHETNAFFQTKHAENAWVSLDLGASCRAAVPCPELVVLNLSLPRGGGVVLNLSLLP